MPITLAQQHAVKLLSRASAGVQTPAASTLSLFLDSTSLKVSAKNSSGTVVNPVEVTRHVLFRVIEKTTDWSANATTAVGGDFVIPFACTITDIEADVDTAGTTGTATVDVNKNGTTIMTTNKLNWDSTEKSTRTYSGTAPGLTTTSLAIGDIITIDIDTNHTTKSKGLTLYLALLPT